MKESSYVKTMKTVCGKTITYYKEPGEIAKAHSTTGPAFIYPESEGKAPEYYLYGIKYKKADWQALIDQQKSFILEQSLRGEY